MVLFETATLIYTLLMANVLGLTAFLEREDIYEGMTKQDVTKEPEAAALIEAVPQVTKEDNESSELGSVPQPEAAHEDNIIDFCEVLEAKDRGLLKSQKPIVWNFPKKQSRDR